MIAPINEETGSPWTIKNALFLFSPLNSFFNEKALMKVKKNQAINVDTDDLLNFSPSAMSAFFFLIISDNSSNLTLVCPEVITLKPIFLFSSSLIIGASFMSSVVVPTKKYIFLENLLFMFFIVSIC